MTARKAKLWDRGDPVDVRIERFTVGCDPDLDLLLLPYDALGSMAHATMLAEIGVLKPSQRETLRGELSSIVSEVRRGRFIIAREEEDGHTAIENRLTAKLGDVGRRIHTGRSRNDQVIAALRLMGRERLLDVIEALVGLAEDLLKRSKQYKDVVLPGYTHTRQAMPTTVGHLFAAHAEGLIDNLPWLTTAFDYLNRSPLGSASGYGVAMPVDRQEVADLLGFRRLQHNTLAVQNDRGKTEMLVIGALLGAGRDLSRLASDVILFSADEFGFFRLSAKTTTGSSIMPQKRNPDLWELLRASYGSLAGYHSQVTHIAAQLISGYHRDLQLTKEPFLRSLETVVDALVVARVGLKGVSIDRSQCAAALTPSIAATDAVYQSVAKGASFRTAYKAIAVDPAAVENHVSAQETWRWRKHDGAPGDLRSDTLTKPIRTAKQWHQARAREIAAVWHHLLPKAS